MNFIILILKGMIIGLSNIIPGVSGGTLMITLGIYEEVISTISHFFSNFKKNLKFLIPLGIGLVLSLLLFSKLIGYSLDKFPFATTLFFIGLILGGIPLIIKRMDIQNNKKIGNVLIAFLAFLFIILFALFKSSNNVELVNLTFIQAVLLFIVGVVSASTMVIPGISGSFVLMLLGYYKPIIDVIRKVIDERVINQNVLILVIFGLGVVIGIVLVSKLIEFLLKKHEIKTYYAVFGFVLASIVAIVKPLFYIPISLVEFIVGILLLALGIFCSYKISHK